MNHTSSSVPHSQLPEFARGVLEQIAIRNTNPKQTAFVVALSGNLGAGKTTCMQALAKELGVQEVVQSPTYVLMKSYPIAFQNFTKLIHIDAYRLDEPEQFASLKPEEFLHDPKNLVCIEWPERLEGVLPKPDLTLNFSSEPPAGETRSVGDDSRYIEVV